MYSGVLRLAQKYDASKIRKSVLDSINREWPSNLEDWDERQHRFKWDKAKFTSVEHSPKGVRELYPEPGKLLDGLMKMYTDDHVYVSRDHPYGAGI